MVSVVCPSFALWAQRRRTDPADPLVLTVEQRNLVLVHDASPAARAAGAAPGQPLTDARALVPKLKSVAVDPARITAGWHRVAHWLTRYTPLVALDPATPPTGMGGSAGFMLDISGCAHLFGGEAGLLQDLSARVGHWGLGLQAAMADTPLAAWGLARYGGKPLLCVPPGETRAALYPLPVTALNLPEPTVEALDRLGLRRIKDLVALDRRALGQRFSEKLSRKQAAAQGVSADRLLDALDRATGQRADVIDPLLPAASYAARKLFPEPIGTAEAIEQTLIDLMAVVLPMVRRAGQGVRIALVALYGVDGSRRDFRLRFHRPTRDPGLVLRLFREQTETLDVGFGLDAVGLAVQRAEVVPERQDSLLSHAEPGAHHPVLDRLSNRLGEAAVSRPTLLARHGPRQGEIRQGVEAALSGQGGGIGGAPGDQSSAELARQRAAAALDQDLGDPEIARQAGLTRPAPPRPLILFPRPQPVKLLDPQPLTSGLRPPRHFEWRRRQHRLVAWRGPERLTPAWWEQPNGHLGSLNAAENTDEDSGENSGERAAGGDAAQAAGKPANRQPVTRDFFHVEDAEGRQLWMARTCSSPDAPFGDRTGQADRHPARVQWTVEGLFA